MKSKAESLFTTKIEYANFNPDNLRTVAVRIFDAKIPYDPEKDYADYHSFPKFLEYERQSSSYIFAKLETLDAIKKW